MTGNAARNTMTTMLTLRTTPAATRVVCRIGKPDGEPAIRGAGWSRRSRTYTMPIVAGKMMCHSVHTTIEICEE